MIESLLIMWRETLEATLIVGILLTDDDVRQRDDDLRQSAPHLSEPPDTRPLARIGR